MSVYIDDILISGSTKEEHLRNLDKVLGILADAGIRLNRDKYTFLLTKMEYLGHVIDQNGLHPTGEKVRAIQEAPRPQNVAELRAFLRIMGSFSLTFLHSYRHRTSCYRRSRSERQDTVFKAAKDALQANSLLVHYDGTKPLVLACDASPVGLGAVLSHIMPDRTERPVAYATLSPAEKNYSHVEKEGLAVVYGVTTTCTDDISTLSPTTNLW